MFYWIYSKNEAVHATVNTWALTMLLLFKIKLVLVLKNYLDGPIVKKKRRKQNKLSLKLPNCVKSAYI